MKPILHGMRLSECHIKNRQSKIIYYVFFNLLPNTNMYITLHSLVKCTQDIDSVCTHILFPVYLVLGIL